MPHALGIDIGSVAVKLAIVGADGELLGVWSRPILRQPAEALGSLIAEVPVPPEVIGVRIGVTGDGCELVRGPVRRETAVVALTRAVPVLFPDARTAIEIGGHSARYVVIEPRTLTLLDYGLNQQCAAGSGSFFEQQAGRLGLDVEAFARLSAGALRGATVAGRCSVFAKSDMIHLQQKGTPVGEIAYGLCLAMARNFVATVIRGRQVVPPLALAGGGAANQGLVRAFAEVLGLDAESLRISPNPGGEGAVGAALSAFECDAIPTVPWANVMPTLAPADLKRRGSTLAPLAVEPSPAAPAGSDAGRGAGGRLPWRGRGIGEHEPRPPEPGREGLPRHLPAHPRPAYRGRRRGARHPPRLRRREAARARRRGHGQRPPPGRALAGRGPGQERDHLPAPRRGRDRA